MSSSATNPAQSQTQATPNPSNTISSSAAAAAVAANTNHHIYNLHHVTNQHHSHHHHHQQTINSLLNQAAFNQSANLSINTNNQANTYQGQATNQASATPSIQSPAGQSTNTTNSNSTSNNNTESSRFTSSDTWTSVVHSLMCHLQSSDNEQFAKRAIESLAKKLKDKPDEMDALMTAVQKKGTIPTKCITIPRTLDGRLQVAGRKGFPHVIYARLWRWPDLHKNELKHLPICSYPFDLKLDNVCVNPYHYQRVISPGFDLTGLTLSTRPFSTQQSQYMPPQSVNQASNAPQPSPVVADAANKNDMNLTLNPPIKLEPTNLLEKNSNLNSNSAPNMIQNNPNNSGTSISTASNSLSNTPVISQANNSNQPTPFLNQLSFGNLYIQNPSHQLAASNQFYPQLPSSGTNVTAVNNTPGNNLILNSHQLSHNQTGPTVPNQNLLNLYSNSTQATDLQLNHLGPQTTSIPNLNQPRRLTQDWQGSYPAPSPYSLNSPLLNNSHHQPAELWLNEEYPEIDLNTPLPEYWCTINYYESDLQIGDIFKVRSAYHSVIIDGFFDSSREDRFCLGALTNVQRTNASEKARLHIGKGVQLENLPDGSVYVRCLSDYSVFFESYYLDRESGREPFDAVHKIYPGSYVKVFSLKECLRCLKLAATMEQQANSQQQQQQLLNNNLTSSGINVDDLRRLCRLRFSFVKGWGPDYPRKTILETPCWCEVQLNRPLQYLDQLINSLSLNNLNPNNVLYPD